ncbi:hypothetical protein C9374_005353 [Naegleria lovaniensis]|uniref:MRG domain-containing protein n=1 Tax=Naegleria lovaniensis TaxID=51637 RepID=A0AA88GMY1_NAELO|nr:uncharacterized protein C9374_005353 [Naegleria lovaniensis]KAG2382151.1 hypothetical protein C9374_005353 [Naegleria lovaniensis]
MKREDLPSLAEGDFVFCRKEDVGIYFRSKIGTVDLENKTLHLHYYHMSQEEDLSFEEAEQRLLKFSKSNEIRLFNDKKLGMKSGNIRPKLEKLETTGKPYHPNDKANDDDDDDADDYEKVTNFEKDKQGKSDEASGKRKREESSLGSDNTQTLDSSQTSKESTSLKLPQFIRQELYKDFVQVRSEKKLHKLNKDQTVALIVEGYLKELEEQEVPDTEYDICKCVMDGVVNYFDNYCENFLLYPEEEAQFDEEQRKRKSKKGGSRNHDEDDTVPASTIYGLHHLLRLFTILPKLLSRMPEGMSLRQSTQSLIYQKLEGFFGYLELFMQNVQ